MSDNGHSVKQHGSVEKDPRTGNLEITIERFGRWQYVAGNWFALSALVILYKFTPLKIEWIGLIVVGIYMAIYVLVLQRRRLLQAPA